MKAGDRPLAHRVTQPLKGHLVTVTGWDSSAQKGCASSTWACPVGGGQPEGLPGGGPVRRFGRGHCRQQLSGLFCCPAHSLWGLLVGGRRPGQGPPVRQGDPTGQLPPRARPLWPPWACGRDSGGCSGRGYRGGTGVAAPGPQRLRVGSILIGGIQASRSHPKAGGTHEALGAWHLHTRVVRWSRPVHRPG